MAEAFSIADWWRATEQSSPPVTSDWPAWAMDLAWVAQAELSFRIDEAQARLRQVDNLLPTDEWRHVAELLALRLEVRECRGERLAALLDRIADFTRRLSSEEQFTSCRAWHLLGIAALRSNRFDEAETGMTRALELAEEGPEKNWILDGFGQVFIGQGAWEEARRTLLLVSRRKALANDTLGVAISSGHLALLELKLGRPAAAQEIAEHAMLTCGEGLAINSRMRLTTLVLEALLKIGDADEAQNTARRLTDLMEQTASQKHYLKGFACIALARAAAARQQLDDCRQWLDRGQEQISLPDQLALLRVGGTTPAASCRRAGVVECLAGSAGGRWRCHRSRSHDVAVHGAATGGER